jgi:DNA (cytosine-5)-methyltransferase 1
MRYVLDLCSGVGGFSLGLNWAGMCTVAFCENDLDCQAHLIKTWPGIPIHEDIKRLDANLYQGIDIVTAGLPCQPFSQIGQRRGKEDNRWLWPAMLKIIREARPHWIILENVYGIIHMAFETMLSDLEREGYKTRTFLVPACGVNAPHERTRVFLISNSESWQSWKSSQQKRWKSVVGSCQKNASKINWTIKPKVDKLVDGVPFRLAKIKALGNAVVPHIIEEIGRCIINSEECFGGVT